MKKEPINPCENCISKDIHGMCYDICQDEEYLKYQFYLKVKGYYERGEKKPFPFSCGFDFDD